MEGKRGEKAEVYPSVQELHRKSRATSQYCLERSGKRNNMTCLQSSVKHGGGSALVWSYISASVVGELALYFV